MTTSSHISRSDGTFSITGTAVTFATRTQVSVVAPSLPLQRTRSDIVDTTVPIRTKECDTHARAHRGYTVPRYPTEADHGVEFPGAVFSARISGASAMPLLGM